MIARVPFGEALEPLLDGAWQRVREQAPRRGVLHDQALAGLSARLAADLASVVAPSLLDLFLSQPGRRWLDPEAHGAHDVFIERLQAGLLDELLEATEELRALINLQSTRWVADVAAMARALDADRALLRSAFGFDPPAVSARPIGATAAELADRGGTWVVYKQRSVALDAAVSDIVSWYNSLGPPDDLRVLRTIDKGPYGWVERVTGHPVTTPSEDGARLRRCGVLLCLVHLLGGGDLHEANIAMAGPHPVVVDSEHLLRPGLTAPDRERPDVTSTQLLPMRPGFERCGLVATLHAERPRQWLHVGSDAIRQRPIGRLLDTVRSQALEHFRRHGDEIVGHLRTGFTRAYGILQKHPPPLDLLSGCRVRVLLRSTIDYQRLLEQAVAPDVVADPATRRGLIGRFVDRRPASVASRPALATGVARTERAALTSFRTPRFWCALDGTELHSELGPLGTLYRASPLERAHAFVGSMSEAERDRQLGLIVTSFDVLRRRGAPASPWLGATARPIALDDVL